tara:strand:+ start:249 stop:884 length:636 start_codon:yes stop_codon:yes gene_type:complete
MKRKFRVLKARGGMDAAQDNFKTPSSGSYSRSYNPGAGGVVQHGGNNTNITTSNTNNNTTNTNKKSGNIPIIGPVTLGINLVKKFFDRPKKHPFSANTIKQTKKPPMPPMGGDNSRPQLCPDGTMPPCKTTTTVTKPTKPTNTFLQNFKAYNSGGVSSGPPPRRGPNPQVPPIKMRNGKMTNKYKMSCPHRPDGIRGMGAAIKGHKFIGVK